MLIIINYLRSFSARKIAAYACVHTSYSSSHYVRERVEKYLHFPNEQQPWPSQLLTLSLDPIILDLKFMPKQTDISMNRNHTQGYHPAFIIFTHNLSAKKF